MKQSKLKRFLRGRSFLILALIIVMLLIALIVAPQQYTLANLKQILNNLSYMLIIGTGVACLMMCGGIDFATSAHATMSMVVFALLLTAWPKVPWVVILIIMLAFGCCAGAIHAFLTEKLHMMAFICTIGMKSIWSGIALWSTEGNIVAVLRPNFTNIATYYVFGFIPVWFIFALVVCLIYNFIMIRTKQGRSVLMVGGNAAAARLAGINPVKVRSIMFINNGFLAALGAMVWCSQQKQGSPSGLISQGPEMTALTAVMLGGVAFGGGSGSLGGAYLGIVLVQIVAYALQAMNTPVWLLTLINGSLLVIALTIDRFANKKAQQAIGMPGMAR